MIPDQYIFYGRERGHEHPAKFRFSPVLNEIIYIKQAVLEKSLGNTHNYNALVIKANDHLRKIVAEYAEENGFDFVAIHGIGKDAVDITDALIERMKSDG